MDKCIETYQKMIDSDTHWQWLVVWFGVLGMVGSNSRTAAEAVAGLVGTLSGNAKVGKDFFAWYPIAFAAVCLYALVRYARRLELREHVCTEANPKALKLGTGDLAFLVAADLSVFYLGKLVRRGFWLRLVQQAAVRTLPLIVYTDMYVNIVRKGKLDSISTDIAAYFRDFSLAHVIFLTLACLGGLGLVVADWRSARKKWPVISPE
jgi:hypothetical protein